VVIPFSAIYALTWQRTSCNPHTGHRGQASAPPANSGPSPSLPPPLNCIAAGNHEPNALALPQAPTVVPGSCHCVGRVQRPGAGGHASTAHALPSSAIMSIMTRVQLQQDVAVQKDEVCAYDRWCKNVHGGRVSAPTCLPLHRAVVTLLRAPFPRGCAGSQRTRRGPALYAIFHCT